MPHTAHPDPELGSRLAALCEWLTTARRIDLTGTTATTGFRALAPLLDFAIYNSGDTDSDPTHLNHCHDLEREAVSFFAGLFRAPERWWGCVTHNAADATLHALHLARIRLGTAASSCHWLVSPGDRGRGQPGAGAEEPRVGCRCRGYAGGQE
ncbi:hypothetical protein [Micromonospora sp. NPDC007220]|uniref:hypothetical protein n=1 Tax=Micromonospora sp. NPDC007220 TaxID=3154318 RepID=UPI0033BFEB31